MSQETEVPHRAHGGGRRGEGCHSGRMMSTNVRLTVLLPLMGGGGRGDKERRYFLTNKRDSEMR